MASLLGWHDTDIVGQVGEGGVEVRSDCALETVACLRRVVAALHKEEGSPNYGIIFKQLDVCGHGGIQRHNFKSRIRSLLKPAPKDRYIDVLFDALDSDDSNEVVTLKEFAQFARSSELPADFPKPKPKLTVVKRPRSAPAVRRKIRTLSIEQSERAAHPATRKKAIQLLQALHRTVSATDAQLRFGNPPQTRDRLVSLFSDAADALADSLVGGESDVLVLSCAIECPILSLVGV